MTNWQLAAFPLILPWRREFWTLPLYFPDLQFGVIPDLPQGLPYQSLPLPAAALADVRDLGRVHPGDLRQWQAFAEYQRPREEVEDIVRELKGIPTQRPPASDSPLTADPWILAWQLEKMQADQEVQMLLVDQGQEWLADILAPEPWIENPGLGQVPGVEEMVDADLARLRYFLWRQTMAPHLQEPWAPFLLGRSARAIYLVLHGWPERNQVRQVQISLPGCRNEVEWRAAGGEAQTPGWLEHFTGLWQNCLEAADTFDGLAAGAATLRHWVKQELLKLWPADSTWRWHLEIWAADPDREAAPGPVICWAGAKADLLPG
jgi:hypothetical protein